MTNSMLLDTCIRELDKVFDFDYFIADDYKHIFEEKFFRRYRFYDINYDSFAMFKNQLQSKLSELGPRYTKLYISEHVVNNPFVNYAVENDSYNRQRGRNKNYVIANSKNFNNSFTNSGNIGFSRSGAVTANFGSDFATDRAIESNKNISDSKEFKINKLSDSPQNSSSDENSFNDGYITNKTRDDKSMQAIGSDKKEGWVQKSNQNASNSVVNNNIQNNNIEQSNNINKFQDYKDNYGVAAIENTSKSIIQEYGLRGESVTKMLEEWRRSFINIDAMLLDDLRPLFLYVY